MFFKRYIFSILLLSFGCLAFSQDDAVKERALRTKLDASDYFDVMQPKEKVDTFKLALEWRVEAGYVQNNQRADTKTYPDLFLHGGALGFTVDFMLPKRFSLQTGVLYSAAYGETEQHWRSVSVLQTEYITHEILQHQLIVPVKAYYNIKLWRDLRMFFLTGPQFQIGLAQKDYLTKHLSESTLQWLQDNAVHTAPYDRYAAKELRRFIVQYGLGGGFEWDKYRVQAGYDFGLNNIQKATVLDGKLFEWSWFASFCYRF